MRIDEKRGAGGRGSDVLMTYSLDSARRYRTDAREREDWALFYISRRAHCHISDRAERDTRGGFVIGMTLIGARRDTTGVSDAEKRAVGDRRRRVVGEDGVAWYPAGRPPSRVDVLVGGDSQICTTGGVAIGSCHRCGVHVKSMWA